jgi:hypothetical protein
MATILTFRKLELRRHESGDTAGAVSCEVIIFPGIRYERWNEMRDEAAQAAPASQASAVRLRRDVLELAE